MYKIPIRATSWSEEHVRVHEEILRHEQEAAQNKKSKKKKGAQPGEQNSSDGEMDLPSTGSKETHDSKDLKKAEKDRKVTLAKNTATANRAAKALGPLQSSLTALQKGVDKLERSGEQLDAGTTASLNQCITTLRAWGDASRACVNAQEATRDMEELQLLPALPYDSADLKALQQQASVLQHALREALPKKEPKAKAKAAAHPAGEAGVDGAGKEPVPKRRRTKSAA